jgi:flagellar hook assembly protein FlgD
LQRSGDARAGAWLLVGLLVLSVAAFGLTRALRAEDDIVNTVELTRHLPPGGEAEVRFATTIADADADVFIIDSRQATVKTLQDGGELPAGTHDFTWDGSDDAGDAVADGEYGIRVVLNEAGRDIVPPGSINVGGFVAGEDAGEGPAAPVLPGEGGAG